MKCVIVSSIIVTFCLAADILGSKHDSLKAIIVKQCPAELLPPLLVKCNGWDKDVAAAFALGLALGKQCVMASCDSTTSNNSSFNADGLQKEGEWVTCSYTYYGLDTELNGLKNGNRAKVVIKDLERVISANLEWKDDSGTHNPLSEMFDVKAMGSLENYICMNELDLEDARLLLAKCAKKPIAMIAIDVAILQWLVSAIKTKPKNCHMIEIAEAIFMPLCALSMRSLIREHCTIDILYVLSEMQNYADPVNGNYSDVEYYTPSLLAIYKFLEDGPTRTKVEEILIMLCPFGRQENAFVIIRLLLWNDHPFVKLMEGYFSSDKLSSCEVSLHLQAEWNRKMYSIGHTYYGGFQPHYDIIHIYEHTFLSAIIEQDDTLKWETTTPILGIEIIFRNKPGLHPKQVRLFIINQVPTPDSFWQAIYSCASLSSFQKLLTKSEIKQTILSYGITILESSSFYRFTSARN